MKFQALLSSVAFVAAISFSPGLARAQDEKPKDSEKEKPAGKETKTKKDKDTEKEKGKEKSTAKNPAPGELPPEIAAFMKAGTPGEHHKKLEPLNGSWKTDGKFWMAPDAPPQSSPGKCKRTWILDGRFLQEEVEGDFMGMAFKGMGLSGYDNNKKQYVGAWMDTMSTAIMTTAGTCDESGKEFTYIGEYFDPMTQKTKKSRMVIRIKNNDEHVMESFEAGPDGKEFKSVEIVFTRVKK